MEEETMTVVRARDPMQANEYADRFLSEQLYPMKSHHKKEIEQYFPLRSADGHDALIRSLLNVNVTFVCFTNRVGSNLLTSHLSQMGVGIRIANEDFNSFSVIRESTTNNIVSFDQYLSTVVDQTKRGDTVFLKIGAAQLLWLANRGFLSDYFPSAKYIFVRRRDKIAQAVSLYIMNNTGEFRVGISNNSEAANNSLADIKFNKEGIAKELKWIVDNEAIFDYFFTLHSLSRLDVWYEDLVANPPAIVSSIMEHCGLPNESEIKLSPDESPIKSQFSELNARLIAETRSAFAISGRS